MTFTGKTFVAQEIAEYVALCKGERKGRVSIVQFHPTYSYEDFVEGYRPIRSIQAPSEQHSLAFQLVSGPFKELAEEAQKNPQSNFVLIIDELNRGNVAKIFGELFFLLEYRDRNILLQYSNSKFSLPTNLFIIATMNTVDRSLSKLDKALRRRFFFVPFLLDREPVKDLLSKWLDRYKPSMKYVAQVVDKANEMLSKIDEGLSIGPSHFMTSELNKEWFELIWKYSIVPEVEDSFEDEQRLKEFAALPRTFLLDDLREE
jgi:5-methylcytosine-specific restriction protein B